MLKNASSALAGRSKIEIGAQKEIKGKGLVLGVSTQIACASTIKFLHYFEIIRTSGMR